MVYTTDVLKHTCSFILRFSSNIFIYQDPRSFVIADSLAALLDSADASASSSLLLTASLISLTAWFTAVKQTTTDLAIYNDVGAKTGKLRLLKTRDSFHYIFIDFFIDRVHIYLEAQWKSTDCFLNFQ